MGLLAMVAALAAAAAVPVASVESQAQVDVEHLDTIENLSESLANDLLTLSVAARDKDRPALVRYFGESIVGGPLPSEPAPDVPWVKWISKHGWISPPGGADTTASTGNAAPPPIDRAVFISNLEALLEHFVSIEDVRFKVKGADFELDDIVQGRSPAAAEDVLINGTARISFFIVGRDAQDRREWLTGWADIAASRRGLPPPPTLTPDEVDEDTKTWKIHRFELESMDSMVADIDLFSEIAIPAGVHASFPEFGTAPNDTVVAHGVAVADVDNDGLLDVVTTGVERNHLYLNDGTGGFRDVSAETFVDLAPAGTGPLFVDVDNDGDIDLFLAALETQVLLENRLIPDGRLFFIDRSLEAGVAVDAVGFSAAAADVNGDGWQDIYVASYNRYGIVMPNAWDRATNGTPNLLLINKGDGTFREAAHEWGVQDGRWSYAASFADADGDGDQDLYVANDFGENGFFLNDGDHFREAADERGVLDPGNGMGVAFGDYDNDGDLDLHVTNMSSTAGNRILSRLYPDAKPADLVLQKMAAGNSLYANDGNGNFRSVGNFSAGWAFGGGFVDFDNDGWEDVYSPNGFISGETMHDT